MVFFQSANDDWASRDEEEDAMANDEDGDDDGGDAATAVKDDRGETAIEDCDKGKGSLLPSFNNSV